MVRVRIGAGGPFRRGAGTPARVRGPLDCAIGIFVDNHQARLAAVNEPDEASVNLCFELAPDKTIRIRHVAMTAQ